MPYLIDGHNLIPKLGLCLDLPDDEMQLVAILQNSCRIQRGMRILEAVKAHFIRPGTTADSAILSRLKHLGRSARNWTVVSSDRQVQAGARAARTQVLSSETFAG